MVRVKPRGAPRCEAALSRTILLVEPNAARSGALCKASLAEGYGVLRVAHPRQALEAAICHDIDVAVINTGLPEVDGATLMKRLQRLVANLRVILISGAADGPTRFEVRVNGGFDIVYLPCPTSAIKTVVAHAIRDLEDCGRDVVSKSNSRSLVGTLV